VIALMVSNPVKNKSCEPQASENEPTVSEEEMKACARNESTSSESNTTSQSTASPLTMQNVLQLSSLMASNPEMIPDICMQLAVFGHLTEFIQILSTCQPITEQGSTSTTASVVSIPPSTPSDEQESRATEVIVDAIDPLSGLSNEQKEEVMQLSILGFDTYSAARAWRVCNGNLEYAVNLLFDQQSRH
jgi:hypothetical protein